MKVITITLSILIIIVGILAFTMPAHLQILVGLIILAALTIAIMQLTGKVQAIGGENKNTPAPSTPAAPPKPPRAEAEVISLLAALQEKGRFVDFVMDDITGYSDQQVGAAARVVHQGCREVVNKHFSIESVNDSGEGSTITVPENFAAGEYRLTGNLSGNAPITGTLTHKGWKTSSVTLPQIIETSNDPESLPVIAPAEVEVK